MRNYNSANNQYIVTRLLKNCAVLFVEAETQDSALRIFSTLNDRGLPLADADIFKSKFYKLYSDKNQKNDFIEDWKKLEAVTDEIFPSITRDTYG